MTLPKFAVFLLKIVAYQYNSRKPFSTVCILCQSIFDYLTSSPILLIKFDSNMVYVIRLFINSNRIRLKHRYWQNLGHRLLIGLDNIRFLCGIWHNFYLFTYRDGLYSKNHFFSLSSIYKRGSSICRFLFRLFGGFWFSRIRRAPAGCTLSFKTRQANSGPQLRIT